MDNRSKIMDDIDFSIGIRSFIGNPNCIKNIVRFDITNTPFYNKTFNTILSCTVLRQGL